MTFDPMSVEVTCVTLPKDHCVQVPWEYINVCGYSDQCCKIPHTYTYYVHTTYRMNDHIVSYWTQFRRDKNQDPTLVFMVSSSIYLGFKVSSLTQHISYDKNQLFLCENQYSGNLREGLESIVTQGKTQTLVFLVSVSIFFGYSSTLHIN